MRKAGSQLWGPLVSHAAARGCAINATTYSLLFYAVCRLLLYAYAVMPIAFKMPATRKICLLHSTIDMRLQPVATRAARRMIFSILHEAAHMLRVAAATA